MASTRLKQQTKFEHGAPASSGPGPRPLAPIGPVVPIRVPASVSEPARGNSKWLIAAGVVIVLGVIIATTQFSGGTVDATVRTATVERADCGGALHELGAIEALTETPVLSPFQGEIVWKIDDGTFVEAGEPIVRFDASNLEEDLVTAEQTLKDREDGVHRVESQLNYTRDRYQCLVHQKELSLKQAELDRDEVYNFPHDADRKDGELALEAANLSLDAAKHELEITEDLSKRGFVADAQRKKKALDVATNTVNYLKSKVIYDAQTEGSTLDAKRVADLAVKDAQKQLAVTTFNRDADTKVLKATLILSKIQYENAERDLKRKQKVYNSATIKAPVRGRASFIDVWKGPGKSNTPIQVGEQRPQGSDLCVICDVSALRVRVLISEADVKNVSIGQPAMIKLRAIPNTVFKAKVSKLALVAQDKNVALSGLASRRNGEAFVNVVEAKLDFEGLSPAEMKKMRIGYTAEVTINLSDVASALRIPWTAVAYDKDGVPYADVVAPGGTTTRRMLKLGRYDNNNVEIVDGLKEGEKVRVNY